MPPRKKNKKIKNKISLSRLAKLVCLFFFAATVYSIFVWLIGGLLLSFNLNRLFAEKPIDGRDGGIEYATDKMEYVLGENIKLSLVNNLKESIYLAPCWHSKTFENKYLLVNRGNNKEAEWQPINLASDSDCSNYRENAEGESFSKIKKIADEYVSTAVLGAGIFRGVSTVYLRCTKPDATSCERGVNVYSNEFKIVENIE